MERNADAAIADLVDELLSSSHFGERWGRHWMDVWRYSDWAGYKDALRESRERLREAKASASASRSSTAGERPVRSRASWTLA